MDLGEEAMKQGGRSGVHTLVTYREEGGRAVLSIQKFDDSIYVCRWA
jgi:hypothetical protein